MPPARRGVVELLDAGKIHACDRRALFHHHDKYITFCLDSNVLEKAQRIQGLDGGDAGLVDRQLLDVTVDTLVTVLSTIMLIYFLLSCGEVLMRKIIMATPEREDKIRMIGILRTIQREVGRYFATIAVVNISLGIATGLAMWALGMPNPLLWGALVVVLEFIPYLGALIMTAILTLAVAIGINTAVFSVVYAVLIRPLPYPDPARLGLVHTRMAGAAGVDELTSQHGVTWSVVRDHAATVDRAVFSTWTSGVNVVSGTRPSFAEQQRVGAGFFAVLGVSPALGREFSADEDRRGGPAAVILSHKYWQTVLAADPNVVDRAITLRGEPHVVVGVMPPGFHSGVEADLWTPLRATTDGEGEGENYQILLRLREGFTWAHADAEMQRLGAEILRARPAASGATVTFGTVPLQDGITEAIRPTMLMVAAAVVVVLLIACVNLSGLLLARMSRRAREIATRMALGSGRILLVRQLFIETLLLSLVGGLGGFIVCLLTLDALHSAMETLGIWQAPASATRIALITGGLSLMAAALFGIFPAVHATRGGARRSLAPTTSRAVAGAAHHWPRRLMVVAQVALGVVLLVGAGLLVRTFVHLRGLEPGFDGRQVTSATISLQDARYRSAAPVAQLVTTTLQRLRDTPGVDAAAISLGLPYERLLNLGFRHLDGPEASDSRGRMTSAAYIAGDYFEALRIPIRAGRPFVEGDGAGAPPVAVVNDSFARQYFGTTNPVGRRIAFAGAEREIVGVVGNVQVRPGFGDHGPLAAMPLAYIPLAQANDGFLRLVHGWFSPSFLVRSPRSSGDVLPAIRQAIESADPLLPLAKVRSLDEVQAAAVAQPRLFMTLLVTLAGSALLLAAVGIASLIASSVTERTREIGIRMALGATTARAIRTSAAPGVLLAIAGIGIGGLAARSAVAILQGFIWGVSPTDPATFVVVAVLFVAIAAAASLIPALRILRVDPAVTLRQE